MIRRPQWLQHALLPGTQPARRTPARRRVKPAIPGVPTGPIWLILRQIVLRSGPPGGRLLTVPEARDPPVPEPGAGIESDAECTLSLLGGYGCCPVEGQLGVPG